MELPTKEHATELRSARSFLELKMALRVNFPAISKRFTHIIATIGPKTQSVEKLVELVNAGVDVVRMNFSHGSHEFHGATAENARKAAEIVGRPIAIALDTKGPEIRTGRNRGATEKQDNPIKLEVGKPIVITIDPAFKEDSTAEQIYLDYENIVRVVKEGTPIFIDDGLVELKVVSVGQKSLNCVVVSPGVVGSKKGVNLPGSPVDLPALSEKDIQDMQFAVAQDVDMIFASFIRRPEDVHDIRKVLGEAGKHIMIISKIENQQGIDNFDSILEVSDGIMVARGDLGIEIPVDQVFIAQKMMISKCNHKGKPVICATQMLESMTYQARPTRAEASDVANAVLDGSDCVMLSGETAKGDYPIECVKMMSNLCRNAEACAFSRSYRTSLRELLATTRVEHSETTALAAVDAADLHHASAIICISTTGSSARQISKYRPPCPVYTITRYPRTARQLNLSYGITSLVYDSKKDVDVEWVQDVNLRIQWAIEVAKQAGTLKAGDSVICVHGWKSGPGSTNTVRILIVE